MWVEGTANGTYIRRTLKTGSWERATDLARVIEDAEDPATTPERKDEPVTVIQAVTEYLADAKARELSDATVYKLDIFFRKQFLAWCKAEGYRLLREIDLRAVQAFRTSWKDGAMAKKKKQERLTGFFWFCIRANWITMNPTNNLAMRLLLTRLLTGPIFGNLHLRGQTAAEAKSRQGNSGRKFTAETWLFAPRLQSMRQRGQ